MLLVQAKAHFICEDLSKDDDNVKPFIAITGRFSRFTKRYNFCNIKRTGAAASADSVAVIQLQEEVVIPPNPKRIRCFKWECFD